MSISAKGDHREILLDEIKEQGYDAKSLEVNPMIEPNIETLLIAEADMFPNNDTLIVEISFYGQAGTRPLHDVI